MQINKKMFLVVAPLDSEKNSCSLLGYATNIILLFGSEKVTTVVCSEIPFTKNLYPITTSQFICIVNQLSGSYIIHVVTERYF